MIRMALWRLWLPVLILIIVVGGLLKWRSDYSKTMVSNYKANIAIHTEIEVENAKQQIMENFREGTNDIIGSSVVDGMLRAEAVKPKQPIGSSRLLRPRRNTFHADKFSERGFTLGDQSGLTAEQIEFLQRNPKLFSTGD